MLKQMELPIPEALEPFSLAPTEGLVGFSCSMLVTFSAGPKTESPVSAHVFVQWVWSSGLLVGGRLPKHLLRMPKDLSSGAFYSHSLLEIDCFWCRLPNIWARDVLEAIELAPRAAKEASRSLPKVGLCSASNRKVGLEEEGNPALSPQLESANLTLTTSGVFVI